MKNTLVVLLLFNFLPAISGDTELVSISPNSPNAGDNITVGLYAFCPFGLVDQNPQGLTHLFEFEEPNKIILTYIINANVGCVLQPPVPPLIGEFELGTLNGGTYTLETYFASNTNTLPTQNRQLHAISTIQVGAGLPQSVNVLSNSLKLLLFAMMLMIGLFAQRYRPV